MYQPVMTEMEQRSQQTFSALMWALSHPGRPHRLPEAGVASFAAIAEALVEMETSYHTDHPGLAQVLARTGAQAREPISAMYQFYPQLTPESVPAIGDSPLGTYDYPDESATLVIGCTLGAGQRLRLRGPGIADVIELWVHGVPEVFWTLREGTLRYPLGWDIFLVSQEEVVGLPRTTQIEVA